MARGNKNSNVKVMLKDVTRSHNCDALDNDYFERKTKIRGKRKKPFKKFNDE